MIEQTLKELLKPPFSVYPPVGHVLCGVIKNNGERDNTRLLDIRGWGYFQYFENGEELQDEFANWVVQALNEKWERDFGESLKWKLKHYKDRDAYLCPKCNVFFKDMWDYCPNCGQKLDSPEEKT